MDLKTNTITILGKSDATISLILNNLESNNLFPKIEIINNLNLEVIYDFNHPNFQIELKNSLQNTPLNYCLGGYTPKVKKSLFNYFNLPIDGYVNIIHKSSEIASTVSLGYGILMNSLISIAPHTNIGNFVSINGQVLIGHHVTIDNFVTLNPKVCVAGHCEIGEGSTIGMGSNILNGVKIGKNVIIGAGSIVTKDIPDNVVAYGSPCKIIRKNTTI